MRRHPPLPACCSAAAHSNNQQCSETLDDRRSQRRSSVTYTGQMPIELLQALGADRLQLNHSCLLSAFLLDAQIYGHCSQGHSRPLKIHVGSASSILHVGVQAHQKSWALNCLCIVLTAAQDACCQAAQTRLVFPCVTVTSKTPSS